MKYIIIILLIIVLLCLIYRYIFFEKFTSNIWMTKINSILSDNNMKEKVYEVLNSKIDKLKENINKIDKLNLEKIKDKIKNMDYNTFTIEAKKIDPEIFDKISIDLYSKIISESNKLNSNINDIVKKIYLNEHINYLLQNIPLIKKNDLDSITNIVYDEINNN